MRKSDLQETLVSLYLRLNGYPMAFRPFHLSVVHLSNRYIARPVRLFQGFRSRAHPFILSQPACLNVQTGSKCPRGVRSSRFSQLQVKFLCDSEEVFLKY
jgi:hypothetical protein